MNLRFVTVFICALMITPSVASAAPNHVARAAQGKHQAQPNQAESLTTSPGDAPAISKTPGTDENDRAGHEVREASDPEHISALAALQANEISELGLWINFFGLTLIALSFCATAWAAWAASRAARASEESVRLSADVAWRQLRPYVFFHETPVEDEGPSLGKGARTKFAIRNYGRTPAYNVRMARGHVIVSRPIGDPAIPLEPYEQIQPIGPESERYVIVHFDLISEDAIAEIRSGHKVLLILLRVEYDIENGQTDAHEVTLLVDSALLSGARKGNLLTAEDRVRPA